MSAVAKVSEADYLYAVDNFQGWCPECQEFTRDETEGDAEGYDCPSCEQDVVVGAENALIMGLFEIDEDEDEISTSDDDWSGETTCASEPGKFCRFVYTSNFGTKWSCHLFEKPLEDPDGWLLRLPECLNQATKA